MTSSDADAICFQAKPGAAAACCALAVTDFAPIQSFTYTGRNTVAPAPGSIRPLASQPKAEAEAIFFNTLSGGGALHCQGKSKAALANTQAIYNVETLS